MPTGKNPTYCWDSCVFISLLNGEDRTDDEMRNLRAVEKLSDEGGCNILTASITLVEVLACQMTAEQEDLFQALLLRSNVTAVSITPRIAVKAREIRDYYVGRGMKLAVPDSIHLATAIQYNAVLHTYDGCGPHPKPTDLLRVALPLIEKYALKVCKPEPPPPPLAEIPDSPDMHIGELPFGDPEAD